MHVRPIDLATTSGMADAYRVECEATRQTRHGWVPLEEAARIAGWRAGNGWTHQLVGAFEDDAMIGFASASTAQDTPGTTWVDVCVAPRHQRQGVGTRLVLAAEATSPKLVTRFVASAYRPTSVEIDDLVRRFAEPLGYRRASTETVVELALTTAALPATRAPDGCTVATYVNGVPEHLRAQVGILKGLVDAEAPNGDLGWQPAPVTPEEYAEELALWQEQGRTAIESIASTETGDVIAWTCLVATGNAERPAQVEGTMVLAEHRGSGLGKAVKTASLLAARDHTRATRVRTSSEDQNVWMRAINKDLGFVDVESEIIVWKQRRPGSAPD